MSHRIVYGFLAVRISAEVLKQQVQEDEAWQFYGNSRLFLFELGGDNNLTTDHPRTGKEVGARRWILGAFGDETALVEDACRAAVYCEGGGLRLHGDRSTSPENYIRRVRSAIKEAVTLADAKRMGFEMSVTLELDTLTERGISWRRSAALMSADISPQVEGDRRRWSLSPLDNLQHAAHLFLRGALDEKKSWEIAKVQGPTFDFDAVRKSFRTGQVLLDLAA